MSRNSREIVDNHADLIETFVTARELFGQVVVVNGTISEDIASNPREMVVAALKDIADFSLFGDMTHSLEKVVGGAASLEFLVRYSRKLNPAVMPPALIPSDEVVNAALELFHAERLAVTS